LTFCAAFKCLKSAYTANMGNPDRIDITSVAEYKSSNLYSESSLRTFRKLITRPLTPVK